MTLLSGKTKVSTEERFHTPSEIERKLGLWIDRIGASNNPHRKKWRRRTLGMYGITLIEAGSALFECEATGRIVLLPGDVVISLPKMITFYKPAEECSDKWIIWDGSENATLEKIGVLNNSNILFHGGENVINTAYALLEKLTGNDDVNNIILRKSVILEMIVGLQKLSCQNKKGYGTKSHMEKIVSYLTANYADDNVIENMFATFQISPTHLRRLFRRSAGQSPHQLVISLRISKAKELLSQGISIKEASRMVGYEDVSYFIRIFRKVTGISPGNFASTYS